MPSYDIFFFSALFFLIGVFLASIGFGFWILVLVFAAFAAFLFFAFFRKRKITLSLSKGFLSSNYFFWLAGLALFIIIGALYYTRDDVKFRESINVPFERKSVFSGIIVSNPVLKTSSQEFKLELESPLNGNILVKTARYPEFGYGDEVNVEGEIKRPFSGSYANYLAKERVSGVVSFAKVEKTAGGNGNAIKSRLFEIKNKITSTFARFLPPKESALLAGLTLGEQGEFSEDFKEAMSKSGTTHLVALSGYNITIIVWAVMGLFVYFLSRRLSFALTILVILGFVIMTGAEASVVRAGVMGILVMLAHEVGRLYDFRNAVILAGLVMVLQNPKVLVFDIGFQLSFLALLGIIYLRPAIQKLFRISENSGFLSWKDNLMTTVSAQFMVAPLLIANFGSFSLTSFLANVVILEFIPVTMALGFAVAALALLSYHLALVLSLIVQILLKFEILIIELFAKINIPFGSAISKGSFIIYYLAIFSFIVYARRFFRKA